MRTPHRFELTLSEPLTIGMRRAAQRMVAHAKSSWQAATTALAAANAAASTHADARGDAKPPTPNEEAVRAALEAALAALHVPSPKGKN